MEDIRGAGDKARASFIYGRVESGQVEDIRGASDKASASPMGLEAGVGVTALACACRPPRGCVLVAQGCRGMLVPCG